MSQIAIVGAGMVGTQVASTLMMSGSCSEILMVDVNQDHCNGEVLDLEDASFVSDTHIRVATFQEAANADIIFITAGVHLSHHGEKREHLLDRNALLLKDICENLGEVSSTTVVVVVADPVDVLVSIFQRISGLPTQRVFGAATFIDSIRLRRELSHRTGVAISSIHFYIVGEHGDMQIPLLSTASIAGVPISKCEFLNEKDIQTAINEARNKAYQIISFKGATAHGFAACALKISECVLQNCQQVFELSVYSPQYETYISLPAVLGRNGIQRVVVPQLSDSEAAALQKVAMVIRKRVESVAFMRNYL